MFFRLWHITWLRRSVALSNKMLEKKLIIAMALLCFNTAIFSQNLISCPSAESDPLKNGWVSVAMGSECFGMVNWRTRGDKKENPEAVRGSYVFFPGCDIKSAELYQDIDVSKNAENIDAQYQEYVFTGYTRVYYQSPADISTIEVLYLDEKGKTLSSYSTGKTSNQKEWVQYKNSTIAPKGTRTIRIRLLGILQSGDALDAYFDELSLTAPTPLPVELVSFESEKKANHQVLLKWVTASESNNDFFTLERSVNGKSWETIGEIPGAGFSSTLLNYEFLDDNVKRNQTYYRLKQTDFDGKYAYSNVLLVDLDKSFGNVLSIYPNPTVQFVNVNSIRRNLGNIQLVNALGQDVTSSVNVSVLSTNAAQVDLSNLPRGNYTCRVDESFVHFYKQ